MAKTKKRRGKSRIDLRYGMFSSLPRFIFGMVLLIVLSGITFTHYVIAEIPYNTDNVDPNFHIKNKVIEFFEANGAPEMVRIIRCESHFRHYEEDGTILQNRAGSSAIGVAQIMSSVHPDPKIITRYNRKYNMDLAVNDFDITTFEGNIGYALVLYKVNGTRDWECARH